MTESPPPVRRPTLREFQQRLAERLQQARQATEGGASAIAVSTAQGHWLFALAQMDEIIAAPALTPVPLTRPWYLGLIHHRSELIGAVDLDAFLGAPTADAQPADRLLLLSPALSLRCAIRVRRVHSLLDLARLNPVPALPGAPAWAGPRFADRHQTVWTRVDAAALLTDPAFLDIGQA